MVASGVSIYYNGVVKNIPPLGPAPTPLSGDEALEVTDPSRRRLLQVIARCPTSSPPSVGDLVATVGGHPNTTRHHLRLLVGAGLVLEQHTPPEGGRGRPAARYSLTRAGRAAASPTPGGGAAEEYVALAAAFAERLAERDGDPGADARAIGSAWGAGLAARHAAEAPAGATAGDRVVGLLDRLGFSPETEPAVGSTSGTTVLLRTLPAARCGAPAPRGGVPGAPRAGGRRPRGAPRALGRRAARAVLASRGLRAHPAPHTGVMTAERPAATRREGRRTPLRSPVRGRHPRMPTSPSSCSPAAPPGVSVRQARRTAAWVDRARDRARFAARELAGGRRRAAARLRVDWSPGPARTRPEAGRSPASLQECCPCATRTRRRGRR